MVAMLVFHDMEHRMSTQKRRIAPFTGEPGIQYDTNNDLKEAFDIWQKFMPKYFLHIIVDKTNKYADQKLAQQENLGPYSRLLKWKPVVLAELKEFFGLVIGMGQVHKSSLPEYWSTDPINETPVFSKYIGKDRFSGILRNLHLVDNTHDIPS